MGNSEQSVHAFATTCWTEVLSARVDGAPPAGDGLARLCAAYWPPLYAFLRRDGCSPQEAEDLVQGFFEQFIVGDYLRDVSRDKGRFRSFLIACLKHYAANVRREERTQRRGGSSPHFPLGDPEALQRCEAALAVLPADDSIFDRVWAETIIHKAVARLRNEYSEAGKETLVGQLCHWLVAEAKAGDYARAARGIAAVARAAREADRYRELFVAAQRIAEQDVFGRVRHGAHE